MKADNRQTIASTDLSILLDQNNIKSVSEIINYDREIEFNQFSIFSKIAMICYKTEQYNLSSAVYEKLSKLSYAKDYTFEYYMRSLLKENRYDECYNVSIAAVSKFPTSPNVLELAGWTALKAGQFIKACDFLIAALAVRDTPYVRKYLDEALEKSSGVVADVSPDLPYEAPHNRMTVFPIGSSRLHEPLEALIDSQFVEINFPSIGYFHSPRQIRELIRWLNGERKISPSIAKLFFRKDGTKYNRFDTGIFDKKTFSTIQRKIRNLWNKSELCIIEISSDITFLQGNMPLQGNPNFYRDVPYSEVWKGAGYYDRYEPTRGVIASENSDEQFIEDVNLLIAECHPRPVVLVPHHSDGTSKTAKRERIRNLLLKDYGPNVATIDTRLIVEKYGFRILQDGTTDIHHIAWDGVEAQSKIIENALWRLSKIQEDRNSVLT